MIVIKSLDILVVGDHSRNQLKLLTESGAVTLPGGTRLHAGTIPEVQEILQAESPDVVLIDRILPKVDELDLLRTFRNRNRYVPVVLLTDDEGNAQAPSVLRQQADHVMSREELVGQDGADLENLLNGTDKRVNEYLKIFELELINEANLDPLTKLPDETALRNQLKRCLMRGWEVDRPFTLISVRIDNLHTLEDELQPELLKWAADLLTVSVREEDFVAREDEAQFYVLTPAGPMTRDLRLARKIRAEIEFLNERLPGDVSDRPRCRIGLASPDSSATDPKDLIREAGGAKRTTDAASDESVRGSRKLISTYLNRFFRNESIPT